MNPSPKKHISCAVMILILISLVIIAGCTASKTNSKTNSEANSLFTNSKEKLIKNSAAENSASPQVSSATAIVREYLERDENLGKRTYMSWNVQRTKVGGTVFFVLGIRNTLSKKQTFHITPLVKPVRFNYGTAPFDYKKDYIKGWVGDDIYKNITLSPNEMKVILIKFSIGDKVSPTEETHPASYNLDLMIDYDDKVSKIYAKESISVVVV